MFQIIPKLIYWILIVYSAKGNAVQPVMQPRQICVDQTALILHLQANVISDVVQRSQHATAAKTGEADHATGLQHLFDLRLGKLVPQQRLEQTLAEDLVQPTRAQ